MGERVDRSFTASFTYRLAPPDVNVDLGAPGNINRVIADLTTQAAAMPDHRCDGLQAAVRYLSNPREFLRYDHALEQGWPITTGVIEGTAHDLVGDRLEITGSAGD
ncbi:hypothetical protein OG417_34675 [Actinoallomurus sp. NBC_01490]|uniref:hypothetical protein n=1 Tax=Actinoallomurus sp. NBC_01490 TaxID=2903557 RepID=UPI002E30A441|nr:hypothetical protein [Actinoallomurus sp. NBC_01490]